MDDNGRHYRDLTLGEAAVALALPTAVVTFVESVELAIAGRFMAGSNSAMFVLQHGHWLLCVGLAITTAWTCKFGAQGVLASFAGTAIALFSIFRFRGSHEWYGTFTVYDRDPRFWQLSMLAGVTAGIIIGLRFRTLGNAESPSIKLPLKFLIVTTGLSWLDSTFPSMNPFVPTRQWALLVLLAAVAGAIVYQLVQE